MRVSPTPEQLEYLASLGVSTVTPPARTSKRNVDSEAVRPRIHNRPPTLQAHALVELASGLCSGAIGLFLGGFFGLITHGLTWGLCIGFCTAIGWLMIGFLWGFGSYAEPDLDQGVNFSKAQVGITVAMVLGAVAFVMCFCGMLVAVMLSGPATARAWIRGTLLVIWAIGLVPALVLAVSRWIQAERL